MKFLDAIKKAMGERRFRKKGEVQRHRATMNFERAKSVALLYEEKGESFFILVKQYVKYLKAEVGIREVIAMSYIPDAKHVPHYHLHRLRYDYFTQAELNFYMEPKCEQCENFSAKSFDILINLERVPSLPLRFMMQESKARFKVGYFNEAWQELYDMMIKVAEHATFDDYVKEVNHYLNVIDIQHARA